jgi:hypothetical protein
VRTHLLPLLRVLLLRVLLLLVVVLVVVWLPRPAASQRQRRLVLMARRRLASRGLGAGAAAAALCRQHRAHHLAYGDEKVANREIRVWHGATGNGPWMMDKSKTPPTHLKSWRYLTLRWGVLDWSIIQ